MRLRRTWVLLVGLPLVVGTPVYAAEKDAAIAAIKKLEGSVQLDANNAVVKVHLNSVKVTDADLEHLKGLTSLQGLSLALSNVTDAGLLHLKGLTDLQSLDLRKTKVTDAGLVHLKGLTKLEHLELRDTKVKDEGVEKLQQALPKCHIIYTNDAVAAIKKLGGRVFVGKNGELVVLTFIGPKVTDTGLEHLKGMTDLTILSLLATKITDAGLEHLKGLSSLGTLVLVGTKITDAGLEHLKGLTSLKSLNLRDTNVTDEGVAKLQLALPTCKIHH